MARATPTDGWHGGSVVKHLTEFTFNLFLVLSTVFSLMEICQQKYQAVK